MAHTDKTINVSVETGQTRTFAAAVDWPGWCRSGRDEASALQTLCDYGPRYARVLQGAKIDFHPPADVSALLVVEHVKGNATTDFGAPDRPLSRDAEPIDPAELTRWQAILTACWEAFDAAVQAAHDRPLRKGPRGGGRDLARIVQHVQDVDTGYLRSLGGTLTLTDEDDSAPALTQIRQTILTTLTTAVKGEIPAKGPRGGVRWTPRYFVRRLAWHELDHTWEIEDRAE